MEVTPPRRFLYEPLRSHSLFGYSTLTNSLGADGTSFNVLTGDGALFAEGRTSPSGRLGPADQVQRRDRPHHRHLHRHADHHPGARSAPRSATRFSAWRWWALLAGGAAAARAGPRRRPLAGLPARPCARPAGCRVAYGWK